MKTMKTLILAATLAVAVSASASQLVSDSSGGYHSDPLLATNTILNGASVASSTLTNFVASNYAVSSNPNIGNYANGIFEIKPGGSESFYATQGGVTFQMAYTQITNASTGGAFTGGQSTNITFLIQPLLDDYTIQKLGTYGTITNTAAFPVTLTIVPSSTNGVWLSTAQVNATNFVGCRYAKLINASGLYTNSIQIQSLRAGYWP